MIRFATVLSLSLGLAGFGLTSPAFAHGPNHGHQHHNHGHQYHNHGHQYHNHGYQHHNHGYQHHNHCVPGHYHGNYRPPQHYNYFNSYWFGGRQFAAPFFAHQHYRPTQYCYHTNQNRWFVPSTGACLNCAPSLCDLITVICQEAGQTFYYNAHWNAQHKCYRYVDCHGRQRDVCGR